MSVSASTSPVFMSVTRILGEYKFWSNSTCMLACGQLSLLLPFSTIASPSHEKYIPVSSSSSYNKKKNIIIMLQYKQPTPGVQRLLLN